MLNSALLGRSIISQTQQVSGAAPGPLGAHGLPGVGGLQSLGRVRTQRQLAVVGACLLKSCPWRFQDTLWCLHTCRHRAQARLSHEGRVTFLEGRAGKVAFASCLCHFAVFTGTSLLWAVLVNLDVFLNLAKSPVRTQSVIVTVSEISQTEKEK